MITQYTPRPMPDSTDAAIDAKKGKWEENVKAYKKAVRMWNAAEDDLEMKLKVRDEARRAYEKAQQDCQEANVVSSKRWADVFCDPETGKMFAQDILEAMERADIQG